MRRFDGIVATLVLVALAILLVRLAQVETMAGRPRVVDGDSLVLDGRSVRLAGLDAPELGQLCVQPPAAIRCGEKARDALRALVAGREVSCRVSGRDRYRRDLASCTAGGVDLGRALVRDGFAVAYGSFEAEEREARAAGRGLWAAPFERPSEWRRRHQRFPQT